MSDWHCPNCGMLLGRYDGDWLDCRYKNARYRIQGLVVATCRRCGEESSRETPHADNCDCIECDNDKRIAREAQTNMEKPT
jgi:hypothetical protein